eukprot:CAMPEP_0172629986 /NCGR_PEP_ID=MMETSP1068-20121228/171179_1 /TAXON_ID=35684 /ORGANISM="Pseudopedinella elastica, Strain CCMP716" /LENGTH=157 /DNA_ID=CAMNT_0013440711 /DNA_START=52 /DNA_END=526 /DNA_ORIENTATION=-
MRVGVRLDDRDRKAEERFDDARREQLRPSTYQEGHHLQPPAALWHSALPVCAEARPRRMPRTRTKVAASRARARRGSSAVRPSAPQAVRASDETRTSAPFPPNNQARLLVDPCNTSAVLSANAKTRRSPRLWSSWEASFDTSESWASTRRPHSATRE